MMYLLFVASVIIILVVLIVLFGMFSATGSGSPTYERGCPVCGRSLDRDERVYADEIERSSGPDQLKIKGCTHCYVSED
jgi:hypothetical protein